MPDINTDFTKAAKDVAAIAKDATYVVIGAGVLGYQQAQVQRQELRKLLAEPKADIEDRVASVRTDLSGALRNVDTTVVNLAERLEEIIERLETAVAPLEDRLPPRPAIWPSRPTCRPRRPAPSSGRGSRPSQPELPHPGRGRPAPCGPSFASAPIGPLAAGIAFTPRARASRRARRPASGPTGSPASTRWPRPAGPGHPAAPGPRPAGPGPGRPRARGVAPASSSRSSAISLIDTSRPEQTLYTSPAAPDSIRSR